MDELSSLVSNLLKRNKIRTDFEEFNFQLSSHPSYPSLHAISATLDQFSISNLAANVPVNEETLSQLPPSFIAEVKTGEKKDLAVVTQDKDLMSIHFFEGVKKLSREDFLQQFTGIILAVEKEDDQEGNVSKWSGKQFHQLILGVLFAFSTLFFVLPQFVLYPFLIFTFTLAGTYISLAIIKKENGISSTLSDAFCGGGSQTTDCDSVLNSDGGLLFGTVKLSKLSLIYFLGLLVSMLFLRIQGESYQSAYLISLLVLPITLYSLYYQKVVVGSWCRLCLGIVFILWGTAIISFLQFDFAFAENSLWNSAVLVLFSFLLVSIVGILLFQPLNELGEIRPMKLEHLRFKRNFQVFKFFLHKRKYVELSGVHTAGITFGNPEAHLKLTVITNPLCGHCKEVHTVLEKILEQYGDTVRIEVRFFVNIANKEGLGVRIANRLIDIFDREGVKKCLHAMHEVYSDEHPGKWLERWKDAEGPVKEVLQHESDWCLKNQIHFTPEILVNGWSYPTEYQRTDLLYFVEELIEEKEEALEVHQ